MFHSILFNYFHTVTFLQVDAWLLADQHIKVKGQNNKLYSLSEACQDVVAYEKLTDDVSFLQSLFTFYVCFGPNGTKFRPKIVRKIIFLILGRKLAHSDQK